MAAWRVDCRGCSTPLATPDHVEFLQENERSVHFGLRRSHFEELSETGTLRSRQTLAAWSFTRRLQTHVKKMARAPSTLSCPSCDAKVASEVFVEGWLQPEFLFNTKACDVAVADERLIFSKFPELLRLLVERNLENRVRSPTSWDERANATVRIKTRRARPPPMVFPTPGSVRDLLVNSPKKLSTLRDYQMELLIGALLENTLVYLPTGCGKTLVAVHVISVFKLLNPGRKAVFLVPTVPLVSQQASYLRSESDLRVLELSGQNITNGNATPQQRRAKIDEADVLVVTPQFFANMRFDGTILLEEFCVLVFDEAHHAAGEHPYCDVLRRMQAIEAERRPRIVGLTASPFGQRVTASSLFTNGALQSLCNIYNANLDTPRIVDGSNRLAEVFKKVEWITDEKSPEEVELEAAMNAHIRCLLELLTSLLNGEFNTRGFTNEERSQPNQEVYALCGKLRNLVQQLKGGEIERDSDTLALIKHIRRVLMVIPRLSSRGPLYVARALSKYYARSKSENPSLYARLDRLYVGSFAPVLMRLAQTPTNSLWDKLSAKVRRVATVIEEAGFDRHSRAIVFIHQRKTALWLAEAFARIPTLSSLNPTRFVGHSGFEGMSRENEQRHVLENFRKGSIRMLVATNVLEEGLDVPECSLVVRFDGVVGLTSLVQSRGRARRSEGRFVVMGSESSQQQFHEMISKESALFELACKTADRLKSKTITRELLKDLAGIQANMLDADDPTSSNASVGEEWTELDTKFCVMFGPMMPNSGFDQSPILNAIRSVRFLELDRVDIKLCLLALETSETKSQGKDYASLYDRLCRDLSFRAVDGDDEIDFENSESFWIKFVSSPKLGIDNNADRMGDILGEEPNNPAIECVSLWRGQFVRQDTFERQEDLFLCEHEMHLAKTGTWIVCEIFGKLRVEFDLLSVHNRVVWIETKSEGEWVVYCTLRSAPKTWEVQHSV